MPGRRPRTAPFEYQFSPNAVTVPLARSLFGDWLDNLGVDASDAEDLSLTVSELCALYFSRTLLESLSGTPFRDEVERAFEKLASALTPHMRRFLDQLPRVIMTKLQGRPQTDASYDGHSRQPQIVARALEARIHCESRRLSERSRRDWLLAGTIAGFERIAAGAIRAAGRGETTIAVTFLHDGVTEIASGFPVKVVAPCEGTGFEVGSMSIIKGARNLENAKKFYDWALTPAAQKIGADTKNFQTPSNRATPIPPAAPKMSDIKLINYDFAKYGSAAERKRLLDKWDKEVYALPK